jgi:hypothetical protein
MTPSRVRLLAITLPLVSSSLAFLAWSQPWVQVRLSDGRALLAGGDVAAPAIPPLAIAALALVGALALAGVVFRVILGLLQALLGAGITASGVLALTDPVQAAAATITAATGVEGLDSLRSLVESVTTTTWPMTAIAAGVLAIVIGLGIAATASRWPERTRRFDAVRLSPVDEFDDSATPDRHDAWDALSDGDDPTAR